MLKGKLTPTHFLQGTISKTADVVGSNIQPITIRKNGTYEASNGVDGFSPIYVNTPEPKEEQEKTVDIVENGTVEVFPDNDTVLSGVTIKANVPDTSEIIEDIIDESGVLSGTEGTVTEKVGQLIDKAETEKMWVDFVRNRGDNSHIFKAFQGTRLPIKSNIFDKSANLSYFCSTAQNLERVDFEIGTENLTKIQFGFYQTKSLTHIEGICTKNVTDMGQCFGESGVETITKPFDVSKVNTNLTTAFRANKLREIRFVEKTIKVSITFTSPALSNESVQSIIDGLATVTTAQTLTLNSAITLTDEQKATIKGKGWTLVQ